MADAFLLFFLGIAGLIFRFWLCERKLRHLLEFRALYLSRLLSYYYFLAMAFAWRSALLNVIVLISMPTLVALILFTDIPFFIVFSQKKNRIPKFNGWLMIERLTMHIPPVITAIYWLLTRKSLLYLPLTRLTVFLIAMIMTVVPFLLFDQRWSKKYEWPRGVFVLFTVLLSGIRVYWYLVTLH